MPERSNQTILRIVLKSTVFPSLPCDAMLQSTTFLQLEHVVNLLYIPHLQNRH